MTWVLVYTDDMILSMLGFKSHGDTKQHVEPALANKHFNSKYELAGN